MALDHKARYTMPLAPSPNFSLISSSEYSMQGALNSDDDDGGDNDDNDDDDDDDDVAVEAAVVAEEGG